MDILTYGILNKKVEEAKNVSDEKITEAVNTYLDENPPTTGATAEQAAQINKNVADIGELKGDLSKLSEEKIDNPSTGSVGQILEIESVDEKGKPKTYKAVDKPTSSGEVSDEQISSAVSEYMANNPIEESDPTVPDWAKQPEKPSYTALEVGADTAGTAESKISVHNVAIDSHNDIRLLVQGLTERLNALADSDDTTLDQMSEVVAYIKSNKSLIDAITTSKINVSDIIDNLTTNVSNKPLSAAQGVKLKALIDAIVIPTKLSELENDSGYAKTTDIPDKLPNPQKLTFAGAVTAEYDGSEALTVDIPSGGGSISLPMLYDLTTSEEVAWIDTGDNAFLAKNLLFVELKSIATTTNESDGPGSASMYPNPSAVQAPWANQVVAIQTSALIPKTYTKVFMAFCFRGDGGHWTSITSIRNEVNTMSVTPNMVSVQLEGVSDQPMRGLIIGNAFANSANVLGVGSRLRVWGI